ncbi:pirin family protein [Billgrantia endophytica]|uniref:Quercetin 2,3-dioxygenase n=1 Tax=Billgrantia endophytica TaxID=2033802 RepID=A0A2N7TX13_9GAMM|nr:pirin family protein [Halomonas endophytica]PMR72724.1 quercetin 2,3-dioxygenase [Halomonas endophytica]
MKTLKGVYSAARGHWVGNGFPVRSLFTYDRLGAEHLSPFLMLDYAAPFDFSAGGQPRGVGQHPHRGFETVTLVYQGELEHRDSTGSGGLIGEGDVQWMTAGAGIVHEEFHSRDFTEQGGTLEIAQLWVNLPARDKSAPPAYQTLLADAIPEVTLPDHVGRVRVVAGNYAGHQGPAHTFTPINVWDVRLQPKGVARLPVPSGHTTLLVVLSGTVLVNGVELIREPSLVCFSRDGDELQVEANNEAKLLLLSGEPIDEPVVGHGPFVMNSVEEIQHAFTDFQRGKYGALNDTRSTP